MSTWGPQRELFELARRRLVATDPEPAAARLARQSRWNPRNGRAREPDAPAPFFVGRDAELRALRAALEDRASLTIVHVRGDSGLGKTALVKRFLDEVKSPAQGSES